MVVKFFCEYNGKNFLGFQRQSKGRSVQGVLEDGFFKYLGEKITITGSGRTDTGVSARAQVCSFKFPEHYIVGSICDRLHNIWGSLSGERAEKEVEKRISLERAEKELYKMSAGVNAFLDGDVAIRDISVVDDTFNARFCAKRKTYVYHVYVSPVRRPLFDDTHMQIYKMPDIAGMQKTANELFLGTHDFREFAAGAKRENTTRTIYEFKIEQTGDIEIVFTITGNGFLQRMVRMMVGFLLTGRRTAAPANGLTLWRVTY